MAWHTRRNVESWKEFCTQIHRATTTPSGALATRPL